MVDVYATGDADNVTVLLVGASAVGTLPEVPSPRYVPVPAFHTGHVSPLLVFWRLLT